MVIRAVISGFCLVLWSMSLAQSTGYMGRRVQIGYGFYASPALIGSNANNATVFGSGGSAESGSPAFNVIHEGFAELATSSRWMIGVNLKFYHTTYDNPAKINSSFGGYNYTPYTYDDVSPSGYYSISGRSYGLYFKYYGRRYIAPWGRYMTFGVVLHTATTTYDPSVMKVKAYNFYNYTDTTIANFGPQGQAFKTFDITAGWGRTRMLGKRISVDYGCNFQLFSIAAAFIDVLDLTFDRKLTSADNYISGTVNKRIRGVNRFNAFIKIGILLF
ncbi:MAG: hypothetical protein ACXVPD_08830 [Bacteroidia bacterium]